jgi:hypothetical protein
VEDARLGPPYVAFRFGLHLKSPISQIIDDSGDRLLLDLMRTPSSNSANNSMRVFSLPSDAATFELRRRAGHIYEKH